MKLGLPHLVLYSFAVTFAVLFAVNSAKPVVDNVNAWLAHPAASVVLVVAVLQPFIAVIVVAAARDVLAKYRANPNLLRDLLSGSFVAGILSLVGLLILPARKDAATTLAAASMVAAAALTVALMMLFYVKLAKVVIEAEAEQQR